MNSITQVQQQLLGQMQQLAGAAGHAPVRPAELPVGGIGQTFEAALRNVDAQQHQAGAAMAAVDRGESDDLVGAMLESQKASVSFSALLQVRNKLSTAFDDVMRMPL
ncbi:flagellar hook-basal body complex protein FliE [Pseudomonas oligotrophica]|uniref:flagellar hook-basal body complex protein FliE n=1 Tax=Pseudomonas oligotrophica TaxID=2912055 RepID=UPI001F19BEAB|nr:flagellar hook-basal body complex protein FliE [Pseudomonas oligotrophica]MCF7200601.1 flagellar hook-basal body complex protein FliE [Pseudomonas oligotrophica]